MKRAALFFFLCLALQVDAAHVLFNFYDFTQATSGLTNCRVLITPKSTPRTNDGKIVSSDRLTFWTDTNGSCTASNVVYGTYQVELQGPFAFTPFLILVPDTNTLVNAADLLATSPIPASTAGYTQSALNAMLATNVISHLDAGTNVTFTTNGTRLTIAAPGAGGGGGGGSGSLVTLGSGSPEGTDPGTTLYYDVTAGSLWINPTGLTTGWIQLLKTGYPPFEGGIGGGGSSDVLLGSGSPEGVITANPGTVYWDFGHSLWLKQSSTGATGWIQLLRF